jgi:hypothetical protein
MIKSLLIGGKDRKQVFLTTKLWFKVLDLISKLMQDVGRIVLGYANHHLYISLSTSKFGEISIDLLVVNYPFGLNSQMTSR